jgi:hypothetical protein
MSPMHIHCVAMEYIEDPSLTAVPASMRDGFEADNVWLLEFGPRSYPELNQPHVANSYEVIAEAADAAPNSVRKAVERTVPLSDQSGIRIIGADISGVAGQLGHLLESVELPDTDARHIRQELPAALHVIAENARPPQLGRGYGLVCSHLATSVLLAGPAADLEEAARQKIEDEEGPHAATPPELRQALEKLNATVQVGHIGLLRQLVAPGGTVHFGDTISFTALDQPGTSPVPMINTRAVMAAIDEGFTVHSSSAWTWAQNPAQHYEVRTLSLTPKPTVPHHQT